MWVTCHGHNCVKLRLDDFQDPTNLHRTYRERPSPDLTHCSRRTRRDSTRCYPSWAPKPYQGCCAPPVQLWPVDDSELWPLRASPSISRARLSPEAPAGSAITQYLFRPLQPDHTGFKDCTMSSSSLAYRLHQHLQSAGLYSEETCHSFRRGALQHSQAEGADEATLIMLGRIRSVGTLKQYLGRTQLEDSQGPSRRGITSIKTAGKKIGTHAW